MLTKLLWAVQVFCDHTPRGRAELGETPHQQPDSGHQVTVCRVACFTSPTGHTHASRSGQQPSLSQVFSARLGHGCLMGAASLPIFQQHLSCCTAYSTGRPHICLCTPSVLGASHCRYQGTSCSQRPAWSECAWGAGHTGRGLAAQLGWELSVMQLCFLRATG